MTDVFFYGTLCHAPLLEAVLGRPVEMLPATLSDHASFWAKDQTFPLIIAKPGSAALGCLITDLSDEDLSRLDFYSGGFGAVPQAVTVDADGPRPARAVFPDVSQWKLGEAWWLEDWAARWGETVTATARDYMALYGRRQASEVRSRYPHMLVRGASRVRSKAGPTDLRLRAEPGDVVLHAQRQPYAGFFAVEEYDLSYRRFDGTMSETIVRAAFISGDAVTVLPYDPVRDCVLLIEQFRAGPYARGDDQPWQLEAIAGRIDPGEGPEEAARREAQEEAGLVIGRMFKVAEYYPTPGAKSEYIYSYIALADLPGGTAGVFGMAEEAEDIRGHVISFDALMHLVETGEISNAPIILTALWLARERPRLRAEA